MYRYKNKTKRLDKVSLKSVLSLRKLVRDEISFMSDGSALQARGLAMEKSFVSYMKPST